MTSAMTITASAAVTSCQRFGKRSRMWAAYPSAGTLERFGASRVTRHMIGTSLSSPSPLARTWLISALAMSLASVGVVAIATHAAPAVTDACAPGFEVGALPARDQGFVARRVLTCGDHARGQITTAEYRERVAMLDAAWAAVPAPPLAPAPVAIEWASSVRGVSSQYTASSWSAQQVLGPPNVYPNGGDNSQAWASLAADSGPEWIEVAYAQPMPTSGVHIFETFHPGAVSHVELITTSGAHIVAYDGAATVASEAARELHVDVACTAEPIAAVRVTLDSAAVPGGTSSTRSASCRAFSRSERAYRGARNAANAC